MCGEGAAEAAWVCCGGDLRAQMNSLRQTRQGVSGWRSRVFGVLRTDCLLSGSPHHPAYLEAHKLLKLHSIHLSPGLYLPGLISTTAHAFSNRFCCFTDCRIRSLPCLVKVGQGSS